MVSVGADVTRFSPGDEVFGIASGSFAEYATAEHDKLALKPRTASHEQAAASAISGITALQALTDVGKLEAGQDVLVIGASGGVGTFAVQLAKALGAEVTGVASASKLDLVRSVGADHVIDYTRDDATDGSRHYDLIIDIGGGTPVRHLRRALTDGGTLVIVGGEEGGRWTGGVGRQLRAMLLSPFTKQRLTTFISKEDERRSNALPSSSSPVTSSPRSANALHSRTPPTQSVRWKPARHAVSPSSSSAPMETTVMPEPTARSTLHRILPFAWLAFSAVWAVVIIVTDQPAWPLALWIATTVGPLTALDKWLHRPRLDRS